MLLDGYLQLHCFTILAPLVDYLQPNILAANAHQTTIILYVRKFTWLRSLAEFLALLKHRVHGSLISVYLPGIPVMHTASWVLQNLPLSVEEVELLFSVGLSRLGMLQGQLCLVLGHSLNANINTEDVAAKLG